jgi:hypothetical protein
LGAALWGHPEEAAPSSNWLSLQLLISRVVTLFVFLKAGKAVALWIGAQEYEALAVGFAVGFYGFIGIKYALLAVDRTAAAVSAKLLKIVLAYLWFLILGGPVLFGGVWLSLQPMPDTTWHARLWFPILATALIVAGFREMVSLGAHAAPDIPEDGLSSSGTV